MEGYINERSFDAPLNGRYHDGPLKCIVGHDPDGAPIFSGHKVQYGNCSVSAALTLAAAHRTLPP